MKGLGPPVSGILHNRMFLCLQCQICWITLTLSQLPRGHNRTPLLSCLWWKDAPGISGWQCGVRDKRGWRIQDGGRMVPWMPPDSSACPRLEAARLAALSGGLQTLGKQWFRHHAPPEACFGILLPRFTFRPLHVAAHRGLALSGYETVERNSTASASWCPLYTLKLPPNFFQVPCVGFRGCISNSGNLDAAAATPRNQTFTQPFLVLCET
jgi:hypothetical protein